MHWKEWGNRSTAVLFVYPRPYVEVISFNAQGKAACTHCTGNWLDLGSRVHGYGKSRLGQGWNPGPSSRWWLAVPTELSRPPSNSVPGLIKYWTFFVRKLMCYTWGHKPQNFEKSKWKQLLLLVPILSYINRLHPQILLPNYTFYIIFPHQSAFYQVASSLEILPSNISQTSIFFASVSCVI